MCVCIYHFLFIILCILLFCMYTYVSHVCVYFYMSGFLFNDELNIQRLVERFYLGAIETYDRTFWFAMYNFGTY